MYVRYSDALRHFRRQAHVFQGAWHAIVVCSSPTMLNVAFQEAVNTMQGTSHAAGMKVNHAARTIQCANGADIRFCVANSMGDAATRIQGFEFTHIVVIGNPQQQELVNYIYPNMRSTVVPPEEFRTDLVEGI